METNSETAYDLLIIENQKLKSENKILKDKLKYIREKLIKSSNPLTNILDMMTNDCDLITDVSAVSTLSRTATKTFNVNSSLALPVNHATFSEQFSNEMEDMRARLSPILEETTIAPSIQNVDIPNTTPTTTTESFLINTNLTDLPTLGDISPLNVSNFGAKLCSTPINSSSTKTIDGVSIPTICWESGVFNALEFGSIQNNSSGQQNHTVLKDTTNTCSMDNDTDRKSPESTTTNKRRLPSRAAKPTNLKEKPLSGKIRRE